MDKNIFLFQTNKSRKTTLDKAYNFHISKILQVLDEEEAARWETYNLIITELINDGHENYFDEVKYRLTDGENPNHVIKDILERDLVNINGLVWLLKRRIDEYIEEDDIKRFYV